MDIEVLLCLAHNGTHKVFRGLSSGYLVSPRGEGNTFEKMWRPLDYPKTIAQMASYKFLVSPRLGPYTQLVNYLRPACYRGLFETHITVKTDLQKDPHQIQKFKDLCTNIQVKPVLIELPNGVNPTQMMTASYSTGPIDEVLPGAYKLSQYFIKHDFDIQRTKIEAMCSTEGVPVTDQEALLLPHTNYFEFHIKVGLNPDQLAHMEQISSLCHEHNAHLSKNSFKVMLSGVEERFITLRIYKKGKANALEAFNRCVSAIQQKGYKILTTQREYSVFDSNVQLDSGWIEQTT
uniref:Uncharacterized protein n=1 Tax=Arcella intermedia TaxID=1963864 RepID=A0A6B2LC49_9EUKA